MLLFLLVNTCLNFTQWNVGWTSGSRRLRFAW